MEENTTGLEQETETTVDSFMDGFDGRRLWKARQTSRKNRSQSMKKHLLIKSKRRRKHLLLATKTLTPNRAKTLNRRSRRNRRPRNRRPHRKPGRCAI